LHEAISQKFNYDEFVKAAEYRKVLVKEKGRISYEVHKRVQKGEKIDVILENISSEMIGRSDLKVFILNKFDQFSKVRENDKIDEKTIFKSLLGMVVASVTGLLFLKFIITSTGEFSFFLLVPVYIINYLVIYGITGKTRDNFVVFMTVLISVIVSTILSFGLLG
jgi:undecaprenyl pyrophosphate phosphatase UppP